MKTNTFLLIFLAIIGFSNCEKVSISKPDPLQDAKVIVPEEYLNQLTGLGMVIFSGSNPINMRGIITQESPIVVFDNTDKKKEGEKLVSYLFGITRQTEGDIRLLAGPHVELGHRMSGDGIVRSPDGKNFTIYAKTEGLGSKGRSEYKIIYILSGAKEGNKIVNFQYAYIIMVNQDVKFIEEEGTLILTEYGEADFSPSF